MEDRSGSFAPQRDASKLVWWLRCLAAEVCLALRLPAMALDIFGGYDARPPDTRRFRLLKGRLFAANNDHRAAALEFLDWVRRDPGDVVANNHLISTLLELKLNEFADGVAKNLVKNNAFLGQELRGDLERAGVELTARERFKLFLMSGDWRSLKRGADALSSMTRRRRAQYVEAVKGQTGAYDLGAVADRSPKPSLLARLNEWGDIAYMNVVLIYNILLQRLQRKGGGRAGARYSTVARTIAMTLVHIYAFWFIGRLLPGGVTYLSFTFPGFAIYTAFMAASHQTRPADLDSRFMVGRKIRWISLWLASLMWEVYCVLAGVLIVIFYFYLINDRTMSESLSFIGFPYFATLVMLAYCVGATFGYLLDSIAKRLPFIKQMQMAIYPAIMFTSGTYVAFQDIPPHIQEYVIYNPLLPLTENARRAFSPHYDVHGLSLYYPLGFALAGLAFLAMSRHSDKKSATA